MKKILTALLLLTFLASCSHLPTKPPSEEEIEKIKIEISLLVQTSETLQEVKRKLRKYGCNHEELRENPGETFKLQHIFTYTTYYRNGSHFYIEVVIPDVQKSGVLDYKIRVEKLFIN